MYKLTFCLAAALAFSSAVGSRFAPIRFCCSLQKLMWRSAAFSLNLLEQYGQVT